MLAGATREAGGLLTSYTKDLNLDHTHTPHLTGVA